MSITSMLQKALEARGIQCKLLEKGQLAQVVIGDQEKFATESVAVARDLDTNISDTDIVKRLVASALPFRRKSNKHATLREVNVYTLDSGKKLAAACVGFV
jgi:hypothetical protein